jgi:hypothetical protein
VYGDAVTSISTADAPPPPIWKPLVLGGLALATVAACIWGSPAAHHSEPGIVMNLPGSIGALWGTDQPVSDSERVILPPDTEFAKKLYSDGLGTDIHCQIVLAGAEKRSIHRPEVCLPAQGWTIKSGQVVPVTLANGRVLDVMKLVVSRPVVLSNGQQRELNTVFCYWFVGKNATTPHHMVRVLKTNIDMLLHNVNHRWAYVIASMPVLEGFVPGGKGLDATTQTVERFIADLAPALMKDEAPASNP